MGCHQVLRPPPPRQRRRPPRTRTPSIAGYPFRGPPPCADFAVTRRLRTPLSPKGHPARLGRHSAAKGIARTRRFPSTSAIKTAREHDHASPDPRRTARADAPSSRWVGSKLPMGLGPHPRPRPATPRDSQISRLAGANLAVRVRHELALAPDPTIRLHPGPAEVSRTRGRSAFASRPLSQRRPKAGRLLLARACPRVRYARAPPVTQSRRRRSEPRRASSIPPPPARALAKGREA